MTEEQLQTDNQRGWLVLIACLAAVLLAAGMRFSFAVFVRPIELELGWDRATLSAAASLNVLMYGLGQLGTGFLVDRLGPRRVMMGSLGLMALGAVGMSAATELWHLFFFYGVLPGLAFAGAGLVPASTMLLGWFPRKPALAVGLASAALPAGQAIFVPLVAALMPYIGWRLSYLGFGLLMALLALPMVWLLTADPPRQETRPSAPTTHPRRPRDWSLVVFLSLGFIACGLTDQLVTVHLVPFASGLGLSAVLAATVQSVLTVAGIAGSVLAGRIADAWSPRGVLVLIYLSRAAILPLLVGYAASGQVWMLFAFALVFGPTYIANVAPGGWLLREQYGQAVLGSVMGITQFVHQLGAAVGVAMGGVIYSALGSYDLAWWLAAGAALAGAVVSLRLPAARKASIEAPGRAV